MKHTKKFPKYEGGDNYSVDMVFDNEATISIDRRSRYTDKCNMSRVEMEANALLISKAPELLDHLIHLVNDMSELLCVLEDRGYEWQQAGYYNSSKELIKEATTLINPL